LLWREPSGIAAHFLDQNSAYHDVILVEAQRHRASNQVIAILEPGSIVEEEHLLNKARLDAPIAREEPVAEGFAKQDLFVDFRGDHSFEFPSVGSTADLPLKGEQELVDLCLVNRNDLRVGRQVVWGFGTSPRLEGKER
jgi:hypothetical protein